MLQRVLGIAAKHQNFAWQSSSRVGLLQNLPVLSSPLSWSLSSPAPAAIHPRVAALMQDTHLALAMACEQHSACLPAGTSVRSGSCMQPAWSMSGWSWRRSPWTSWHSTGMHAHQGCCPSLTCSQVGRILFQACLVSTDVALAGVHMKLVLMRSAVYAIIKLYLWCCL